MIAKLMFVFDPRVLHVGYNVTNVDDGEYLVELTVIVIYDARYHIPCLFLEPEELHEDKEFYCPNCIPEKEDEFDKVKDLLYEKILELSGRQIEFGGVTIDRDMFKEKMILGNKCDMNDRRQVVKKYYLD